MNITINPQNINNQSNQAIPSSIPISNIRRHFLVIGTKSSIKNFCHLPSACTGISNSSDWTRLHKNWADQSARGIFDYTLQTGGGQVSITCVDFSCLMPGSENCFTTESSIQALIRPPSLARQTAAPSAFAYQQRRNNYTGNNTNSGNNTTNVAMRGINNTSSNTSITNNDDVENNRNDITHLNRTMPTKTGSKHSHSNCFVISTVFILVETGDARTVRMASACTKLLDDQCQLLNFNHGNVPDFVYVAMSVECGNGKNSTSNNSSSMFPSTFPEVLLDDVVEVSKQLHKAKGRVDEVTLVVG